MKDELELLDAYIQCFKTYCRRVERLKSIVEQMERDGIDSTLECKRLETAITLKVRYYNLAVNQLVMCDELAGMEKFDD